jgi:hypothetical protein
MKVGDGGWIGTTGDLLSFMRLVQIHERERCALVCEDWGRNTKDRGAKVCAELIRELK